MLIRYYNPFARHLALYLLGVVAYAYMPFSAAMAYGCLGIIYLLYVSLCLWQAYAYRCSWSTVVGVVGCCAIVGVGYVRSMQADLLRDPNHLVHHVSKDMRGYVGWVVEGGKRSADSPSYAYLALKAASLQGVWHPIVGRVRLTWEGDEDALQGARPGDLLLVNGCPHRIGTDDGGGRFAQAMAARSCFHQHRVGAGQMALVREIPVSGLLNRMERLRYWLKERIGRVDGDETTKGMMLALLLGMRGELTEVLQGAYSTAGVAHVLAISGLHVGLLYWLLAWLLRVLGSFVGGRHWYRVIAVIGIGCYVLLAGSAPAVVRAGSMTLLAVWARVAARRHGVAEGLAITAFVLLVYDPLLVRQVGFLLSHMAVAGIVCSGSLLGTKDMGRWGGWLAQGCMVSLGAQLATAPLVVYFFGMFPTYFVISNWVVVPMAALMLGMGMATLLLIDLPWAGTSCAALLQMLVSINTWLVGMLASLPYATLGPFYPTWWEVCTMYGIGIGTYLLLVKRLFRYVVLLLLLLGCLVFDLLVYCC